MDKTVKQIYLGLLRSYYRPKYVARVSDIIFLYNHFDVITPTSKFITKYVAI